MAICASSAGLLEGLRQEMLGSANSRFRKRQEQVLEGARWKVRDQEPDIPLLDSACTCLGKCTHTCMHTCVYTTHLYNTPHIHQNGKKRKLMESQICHSELVKCLINNDKGILAASLILKAIHTLCFRRVIAELKKMVS